MWLSAKRLSDSVSEREFSKPCKDFPVGPVVVPLQCRGWVWILQSGTMIPHAKQLSLQATTEFMHHNYDQTQTNKCKEIFLKKFF